MMAGNVLLAVDPSEQAEKAFDWYMENLHRPGNTLIIVHCVDLQDLADSGENSNLSETQTWERLKARVKSLEVKYQWKLNEVGKSFKGFQAEFLCLLYEAVALAKWLGDTNTNPIYQITGKIRTESGKPGEVVIKVASEENAGLVVIGSRGLNTLRRTLIGSVSQYVLHHARCPVVVCRQQQQQNAP